MASSLLERAHRAALLAQQRFLRGEGDGRILPHLLAELAALSGAARVELRGPDELIVRHGSLGLSLASPVAAEEAFQRPVGVGGDGDATGVVALWPAPSPAVVPELEPLFVVIGDVLGAVTRRRRAEQRASREREALRVLNEIAAFPEIEPGLQLARALALGARFLGAREAAVLAVEGDEVVVIAAESESLVEGSRGPVAESFAAFAIRERDARALADERGLRIGAPMRVSGEPYGAVAFAATTRTRPFDEADLEFVRFLARSLGAAVERGRAVAALARSELHYRSVVASLTEAIITQDASGKIVSFNRSTEQILGLTPEQLMGHVERDPGWRLIREDGLDLPEDEHPAKLTLASGEAMSGVILGVYRRAGDLAWVSVNTQPIFEAGPRPVGVVVSFFDISAYKLALEEQRDAAARVAGIVDTVADAILTVDERGVIAGVNPAAERMFGYAATALVGENLRLLMTADDLVDDIGVGVPMGWVGRSTHGRARESRAVKQGGDVFPVEVAFSELELNGRFMFTGVIRDVTDQRRIEEALELASAKSQSLLHAIPDLMLEIDEAGRLADYQPGQGEAVLEPAPFVGRPIGELVGAPAAERIHRAMDSVRGRGGAVVTEFSVAGGEWEARVVALATGGFLAMLRDITERKRVERMKTEFVSTVSHELRTPLTSIRGSLGLLASGVLGALPEKAKPMVGIAQKNAERLSALINDILDVEKLASGQMRFDLKPTDLAELVAQSVEANRGYGQPLDVSFAFTRPAGSAPVLVDQDRVLQVMANLLSNAAKYSPRGGTVRVALGPAPLGEGVCVAVSDDGPGIPEAFRAQVFDRFTQADSSDTRRVGGTGLGLAIAKAIVERMGGTIGFETEVGRGTTFWFSLPLEGRARSAPPRAMSRTRLPRADATQAVDAVREGGRESVSEGYERRAAAPSAAAIERKAAVQ